MIFSFGKRSADNLEECEGDLQVVIRDALFTGLMDFVVIEGHRPKEEQDKAFREGKSRVRWPNGKHNKWPSQAVDCVPYINGKISWDTRHCCVLAGIILTCASNRDVKVRWGGNWDQDGEPITDQDFQDLVHFELA